jgi:hypothetical protein
MCASLAPERIVYTFGSLSVIGRFPMCLYERSGCKNGPFRRDQNQMAIFSKSIRMILVKYQWFMETIALNKISYVAFSGK